MTDRERLKEKFLEDMSDGVAEFSNAISTVDGDWVVKGFIDITRNIYTISVDTKVVSKIMEILLFPRLCAIAEKKGYKLILCREQNFYPDLTFIDSSGNKFAMDLKSTYKKTAREVNGMTLGAFTGYFRERTSTKNVTFAYGEYVGHFVLGLIYSRSDSTIDERKVYHLDDLQSISSVIHSFQFFVQEKYKLALDRPGSGNTKNIGSVIQTEKLVSGTGPFAELGESVFDDYWMYYLTKDMARAVDLPTPPYTNLKKYFEYKGGR